MRAIVTILDRGIQHSKRRSAIAVGAFGAAAAVAASLGYWSGHTGIADSTPDDTVDVAGQNRSERLRPDLQRIDSLFASHEYEQVIAAVATLMPKVGAHRPTETRLWSVSGKASHALGHYQEAAESLEKSFYAAVAGKNDEMAALATAEIFEIYAVRLRDPEGAERWRGLAASAAERAGTVQATGTWLRILGSAALVSGDADVATKKFSEAIEALEPVSDKHGALLASAVEGLGTSLARQGKLPEARDAAERALKLWTKSVGASDPNTAMAQTRLAEVLMKQGEVARARELCERASEVMIAAYGEKHPRVGLVLNALAEYAVAAGDVEAANQTLLRALQIKREVHGSDHPRLASTLINLMDVDRMRGRASDAVIHGTEAVKILEASESGASKPRTERARLGLAEAQLSAGDAESAVIACQALQQRFESGGEGLASQRARALSCMGRARLELGQRSEGMADLNRALEAFGSAERSPHVALALWALAKNNADSGQASAQGKLALELFAEAGPGWAAERAGVQTWLDAGSP